jgi:hypothetical protein
LLEQLKQEGERVPSQQSRPWFTGSLTKMLMLRVSAPQAVAAVSVTVSLPTELAV